MTRDIRLNNIRYVPELNAIELNGAVNRRILIYLDQVILSFQEGVATFGDLPLSGNVTNDARITNDTGHLYVWNGFVWADQGDIIDLGWDAISGGPTSSPSAIDFAAINALLKDTDGTLSANSDSRYATQKAVKTYTDNAVQNAGQIF